MKFINIKNLFFCVLLICLACDNYLDVELDKSKVLSDVVFSDDQNVVSAVNGLYQTLLEGPYGGGSTGISALTGLSADEFHNVLGTSDFVRFQANDLLPDNLFVGTFWADSYKVIYQANDILEGLSESTGISDTIKNQAEGEALFMRAFMYFYLTNLFGDVPLVLTTDYRITSIAPRVASEVVIAQVTKDLYDAIEVLPVAYVRSNRTRPNRWVARALLARALLYQEKWQEAEQASSEVISITDYALETNLDKVFLRRSVEVIWQLAAESGFNSKEGTTFIIDGNLSASTLELNSNLIDAFEEDDQRRLRWIANWSDTASGLNLDYSYKYKAQYSTPPSKEFYVAIRLAEMYLIRAEARAKLGDLDGAILDLDKIRIRAGLKPVEEALGELGEPEFLTALLKERRIEMLAEWGHRWFDLKRTGKADELLQNQKENWSSDDKLYPVPQSEFFLNPKLGDQNDGY